VNDLEEILVSLRQIMRAADLHSQKFLRESGLTTPQYLVLRSIAKSGSPSTGAVARDVMVSQATVTRIIDRLVRAGLVLREKCSNDKRVVNVSLTDVGRERLDGAPLPLQSSFLRRFAKLERWEQMMLQSSLLQIAKMMDADDIDAAPILQPGAIAEPDQ